MKIVKIILKFLLFIFISIFPFSCSFDVFEDFCVVSVSVKRNGVIGTGKQAITVTFSKDIDQDNNQDNDQGNDQGNAEDNIRIETDSNAQVSIRHDVSNNIVVIEPESSWSPHERFWLIVSKEIEDVYGKQMSRDFYLPFQSTLDLSMAYALISSPEIVNGIVTTEVDSIDIVFNSEVDKQSVQRAFSINPSVNGYFKWTSDSSFSYKLNEKLKKNSFYSVQISDNAEDIYGYRIKSFVRDFEYFPNEEYPVVQKAFAGSSEIFSIIDPLTYTIEDGCFIVGYDEAEKDVIVRFEFSKAINKSMIKDNFEVSPFAEWRELWLDESTLEIFFEENLKIDEYYELKLKRTIQDTFGLNLQNDYLFNLHINGENSKFIEFYAANFTDLDIDLDGVELWLDGSKIDNGVQNVLLEKDDEGYVIKIDYNKLSINQVDLPNIEVRLRIPLKFINQSPISIPVLDKNSLQDSVNFGIVFGNNSYAGNIQSFNWNTQNECDLDINELTGNNIYFLKINGGINGVIDEEENYMKEDIDYYFKLELVQ